MMARDGWRGLLWPALCGIALATGQAPLGWWPVALVGLACLMLQLDRPVVAGWVAGTAYFGFALFWIVQPFLVDPARHGWMAPFALILMAGGLALFWGLAGWLARLWQGGRTRAVAFAVALAAVEALRGVVLTGFPWAQVGHIWIGTPLDQWAAVVGANGLTLGTTLAAALPAVVGWWAVPGLAVVASGAMIVAEARLRVPPGPERAASLRLVQPNAEQHLKWDPDQARLLFDRQLAITAAGTPVDLTIWPETSVPYLIDLYPEVAGLMAEAGQGGLVAAGVQRVDGNRAWNSLAVIAPDGRVRDWYDKWHLVPFGEYIPFGDLAFDWFGLRAFAAQTGAGYSAGTGPMIVDLGPSLGRVAPLICYEAVFPGHLRALTERPDWILQVTNDAWFGTLTGPWQHAAQARLRAVEQGLPLVRVANTGLTVVFDAHGHVVADLPFGEATSLTLAAIPGALPPTPYARFGEWPFLVWLGGLVALLVARRRLDALRPRR
jgi:apolipoprotein N-acyltransferase